MVFRRFPTICLLLIFPVVICFAHSTPAWSSEKVIVYLVDGGKIIGQLKEKGHESVTIQTKRMKVSINTKQIQSIKYFSSGTQINTQPPPDEQLQSDVIDHKTCGHYNVLCNRQALTVTVDPTLKQYRHTAPKVLCKTLTSVCKNLKFQFKPISLLEEFYNKSKICFANYITDYKHAVTGENDTAGPQTITTWYTDNADLISTINSSFASCLETAENSLVN